MGAFFCTSGAALEVSLSTAYTACQFFGWDWGQNHNPKDAPIFTARYLIAIVLAAFSLPFSFAPLLIIANDETYMGDQVNSRTANIAGVFFLAMLTVVTVITIPLFVLSGG